MPEQHVGWRPVVLALGSNLGDRAATIDAAIDTLAARLDITITARSRFFESDAVTVNGVAPSEPAYVNAVVRGETSLLPEDLLAIAQSIEHAHGRERSVRWGNRTLDIDIVAMGAQTYEASCLTIPHPRAAERAFVLVPWLDVEPDAILPGYGRVVDLAVCLRGEEHLRVLDRQLTPR